MVDVATLRVGGRSIWDATSHLVGTHLGAKAHRHLPAEIHEEAIAFICVDRISSKPEPRPLQVLGDGIAERVARVVSHRMKKPPSALLADVCRLVAAFIWADRVADRRQALRPLCRCGHPDRCVWTCTCWCHPTPQPAKRSEIQRRRRLCVRAFEDLAVAAASHDDAALAWRTRQIVAEYFRAIREPQDYAVRSSAHGSAFRYDGPDPARPGPQQMQTLPEAIRDAQSWQRIADTIAGDAHVVHIPTGRIVWGRDGDVWGSAKEGS